jgi:hypothetical protein
MVEILAGAALGLLTGLLWAVSRSTAVDVGWSVIDGTLFGLLIGWLVGLFTGATGTLSVRTVLTNMVHIVWVLTVVLAFVAFSAIFVAFADAAYGSTRGDL